MAQQHTKVMINSFAMNLDLDEAIQRAMFDGTYEPAQTAWACSLLRPGSRFVDIGANFGHYTTLASSLVGSTGRILAFEPSPLPADTIATTIAANQITNIDLVRAAVGDKDGEIDLYLPSSGPVHSPSVFPSGPGFAPLRVPVVALDTFPPLNDGRPIDLVKVDVEGFEPNVIAGMAGLIRRGMVRSLMCEFNTGWLRHNPGATAENLLDQILRLGFSVCERTAKQTHLEADGVTIYELQDILFEWTDATIPEN